jgi:hypothetical protein
LRLERLYWKPDSDLWPESFESWDLSSDMARLLRLTPANERR